MWKSDEISEDFGRPDVILNDLKSFSSPNIFIMTPNGSTYPRRCIQGNTEGELSCQQGQENSTEDTTSAVEHGLMPDGRTKKDSKPCCEYANGSPNILASGKLFKLITKATGLWNPRIKQYAMLCAILVILNILSLLALILIPFICGPFVGRCVTSSKPVTNVTNEKNNNQSTMMAVYETMLGFGAWNAFSDAMTYILLTYTLWSVQQQVPSLSLASAQAKVTSHEWLLMNVMLIICSVAITISIAYQVSAVEYAKRKLFGTYSLGLLIVYLTAFTCCYVFAVLTCALGSLADTCFQEICNMGEGNLNEVTSIHQKLCKQLSTASLSLKPWFLVHWIMFGVYCLTVFGFDSTHFSVLSQQFKGPNTVFNALVFGLNLAVFLVPCVYASRVTWKCEDLLFKINNRSSGDWSEGHPFRERANMNEFMFYAERSKCGFRIGKMTFGSSGTWISVLISLLSLGVRVLQYIKIK